MRGTLTGIVSGALVSGLGFVAGERFLPVVDLKLPAPDAAEVAVPAGSEFNSERPDAPPILPGTEAPPEGGAAPMVAAPDPEGDGLPDTTPLDTPQAAAVTQSGLTPPAEAPTPVIVSGSGPEAAPQADVSQPDTPRIDTAAVPVEPLDTPETTAPEASLETPSVSEPSPDAPVTEATEPTVPKAADAPAAPATEIAMSTPEAAAAPDAPASGTQMNAPVAESAPQAPVIDETAVASSADTPPAAPATESASIDAPPVMVPDMPPVLELDGPQGLRLPVPQIEDMAPGVTTDRLPRIGAETAEPAELPAMAMKLNAVPFEAPADSALISLILVDVGAVRPDPAVLADFPVPLTVAIDPTVPNAAALMQAYRQAGLEIAILTPLPEGAAPADVEVAFQSFFSALPEAVVVMDMPDMVLQESRPRAAQVVGILAQTGHGLVTYEKGLNTVMQIAGQSDVPAATVFRDIDPGNHDVAAMKRFLDQAAFRAGLDGKVILKAEARPETLTAIAEWTLGTRAASVTFAPISAVLAK